MTWATQPTVSSEPASASRWCRGWTRQFAGFAARRSGASVPEPTILFRQPAALASMSGVAATSPIVSAIGAVIIPGLPAEPPAARVWPRLPVIIRTPVYAMDFYAFDSRPTMASMALGSGRLGHPRRHGMAFYAERERAFDLG